MTNNQDGGLHMRISWRCKVLKWCKIYTCIYIKEKKNFYPMFMKELQNAWNWSVAIDPRRTDIKKQNKNIYWLAFVFKHVNNLRWKQEVKRMCLNGITCTGTHQVIKVKELQCAEIIFYLTNIINYVYEFFGQYFNLASIVTRGAHSQQ